MALRSFASSALSAMGLRPALMGRSELVQGAAALANRAYATVKEGYKFAKSHEWASVEGDVATVGISDHAQAELGDVVFVELPEVGKQVKQGETFGVVESVKAASDVYAPVSGEVVDVNSKLSDEPATVNKDPYASGWIIKIKLSNKDDLKNLLDAQAYAKEIEH